MEHLLERVEREGLEDREMCKKAWVGGGVLEGGGVGRNVRGGREDGGYENGGGQRDGKGGGGDGGGGEGGEGEWGGREEGVEWAEACQRALDEEELLALYEVCGLGCKV